MSLALRSQKPTPNLNRPRLRNLTKRLLRAERRLDTLEVSLLLCDDATIQALNREYRQEDRPTDVLSFPQEEGPPLPLGTADEAIPRTLGDVALSLDTAQRQADEHGWTLQEEVEALLVHGLLHLLGYDHDTPGERELMRQHEIAILGDKSIWSRASEEDIVSKPHLENEA